VAMPHAVAGGEAMRYARAMSGRRFASWALGGMLWSALGCGGKAIDDGAIPSAGWSSVAAGGAEFGSSGGLSGGGVGIAGTGVNVGIAGAGVNVGIAGAGVNVGIAGAGAGIAGAGMGASAGAPPVAEGGGTSFSLSGVWLGYVEDIVYSDGADDVQLTIGSSNALFGQIRFGKSPPPTPALAADEIYPPGVVAASSFKPALPARPSAGVQFTLMNPMFDGNRLRFDISRHEVFQTWCTLQTSYPYLEGYSCMPEWGYFAGPGGCAQRNPSTMQLVSRSCFQFAMCRFEQACTCSESNCFASRDATAHFDLGFQTVESQGTVSGFDDFMPDSTHKVHLKKQSPAPVQ